MDVCFFLGSSKSKSNLYFLGVGFFNVKLSVYLKVGVCDYIKDLTWVCETY